MKMIIAAFAEDDAATNGIIEDLKNEGYEFEDISIIKKIGLRDILENIEETDLNNQPCIPEESLAKIISESGAFPTLGGILISGPVASFLDLSGLQKIINQPDGSPENDLAYILHELGATPRNARFYTQIVNTGGILLAIPERPQSDVRAILASHGGQRINILKSLYES